MDYYKIGQRIRRYRKAVCMSQEQLAERVNISVTHMSHIETGNTKLSLPVLVDISKALEVRTDELLFDSPSPKEISMTELNSILETCTSEQLCVIVETVKAIKNSFDKYF